MHEPEIEKLIYQAEQLKRLSAHVMEQAIKIREQADRLIEQSRTLHETEVSRNRVN
jgi:hypothetical protein